MTSERGGTRIGYGIGLASIREVHINVSNYPAEYGGAAGGVLNAITKSGTNTFHGSAFFYDRDNRWGARNPRGFQSVLIDGAPHLVALKPVDTRYQFGAAVRRPASREPVVLLCELRPAATQFSRDFDDQRSRVLRHRRSRNGRCRSQGSQPCVVGCANRFDAGVSHQPDRRGSSPRRPDHLYAQGRLAHDEPACLERNLQSAALEFAGWDRHRSDDQYGARQLRR